LAAKWRFVWVISLIRTNQTMHGSSQGPENVISVAGEVSLSDKAGEVS